MKKFHKSIFEQLHWHLLLMLLLTSLYLSLSLFLFISLSICSCSRIHLTRFCVYFLVAVVGMFFSLFYCSLRMPIKPILVTCCCLIYSLLWLHRELSLVPEKGNYLHSMTTMATMMVMVMMMVAWHKVVFVAVGLNWCACLLYCGLSIRECFHIFIPSINHSLILFKFIIKFEEEFFSYYFYE